MLFIFNDPLSFFVIIFFNGKIILQPVSYKVKTFVAKMLAAKMLQQKYQTRPVTEGRETRLLVVEKSSNCYRGSKSGINGKDSGNQNHIYRDQIIHQHLTMSQELC